MVPACVTKATCFCMLGLHWCPSNWISTQIYFHLFGSFFTSTMAKPKMTTKWASMPLTLQGSHTDWAAMERHNKHALLSDCSRVPRRCQGDISSMVRWSHLQVRSHLACRLTLLPNPRVFTRTCWLGRCAELSLRSAGESKERYWLKMSVVS